MSDGAGLVQLSGPIQKSLNSLIIQGAWSIWKHTNECVFNGVAPRISKALTLLVRSARYGVWQEARGCPLPQPLAQIATLSRSGPFFHLLITFNKRNCNMFFRGVGHVVTLFFF